MTNFNEEKELITTKIYVSKKQKLKKISENEQRSLSGQISWIIGCFIKKYEKQQRQKASKITGFEIELPNNVCEWLDNYKADNVTREEAIQDILFKYLREKELSSEYVTIETKKIKDFYDRIYKEMNKFIEDTL